MLHEKIKFEPDGKLITKNEVEINGVPLIVEIEYNKKNQIIGMFTKTLTGEILDYISGDLKRLEEKRDELLHMGIKIDNLDIVNHLDTEPKI
ncbi:MAG: hypothetical protein WCV73_00865 [Patescibacteria group bacterium]|jgi:hypothetical protein